MKMFCDYFVANNDTVKGLVQVKFLKDVTLGKPANKETLSFKAGDGFTVYSVAMDGYAFVFMRHTGGPLILTLE